MGDTIHPRDRISKLPDFIVHHIMSYLSVKKVAQTGILSKRWNYLWTSFPILDFDQTYVRGLDMTCTLPLEFTGWQKERFNKFLVFVDASLLRFCKLKFSVQKFRLSIGPLDVKGSSFLLDKWIGLVVDNEVKELDIHLISEKTLFYFPRTIELDDMYTLPQKLFSAKSMTTLDVCGCKLEQSSGSAGLHFLKNVKLDNLTMRPANYTAFLDGLFYICYPRYLSIEAYGGNFKLFIKWLYRKLRNRDAKCCNSHAIMCWRHYLKDVEIECFEPFCSEEELVDIDNVNKELSDLPLGNLYFRLDWCCFSEPVDEVKD
ncbi:hypothetical protein JRO89_XS09G0174800 [Xanthoceras sorbifolium]|uniref:F-box domain-containing protein n=1 Tax=Xanthoceras sorbifolium TaxID=99658 RepID=A0ABQ8HLL7_9ROSI|nr:hypothetical protein JRO89_XS09G0174800 [Xanthoceras sorbifolium]